jgi:hypothetical protein
VAEYLVVRGILKVTVEVFGRRDPPTPHHDGKSVEEIERKRVSCRPLRKRVWKAMKGNGLNQKEGILSEAGRCITGIELRLKLRAVAIWRNDSRLSEGKHDI